MNKQLELSEEEFKDIFIKHKNNLNRNSSFSDTILEYERIIKEISSAPEVNILVVNEEEQILHAVTIDKKIPIRDDPGGILMECYYTKRYHIVINAPMRFLYRSKDDNLIDSEIRDILVIPVLSHGDESIIAIVWLATTEKYHREFTQNNIEYINRFSVLIKIKVLGRKRIKSREAVGNLASKERQEVKNITILLVDNSAIILRFLEVVLKDSSRNIRSVQSGSQAIEIFKRKDIDIILIDEVMVGMSGHQTIQEIRKIENEQELKPIPICGLTSDTTKETKEALLEAGANKVLYKPIQVQDIIGFVEEFVDIGKLTKNKTTNMTQEAHKNKSDG